MAKLNCEKLKNYTLTKKKSLVESTPNRVSFSFSDKMHLREDSLQYVKDCNKYFQVMEYEVISSSFYLYFSGKSLKATKFQ